MHGGGDVDVQLTVLAHGIANQVIVVPAILQLGIGFQPRQQGVTLFAVQLTIHQRRELFVHASPPFVLGRVQQRFELGRNRLAGAENPRAHGADRAIHGLGDVLVAHAFHFAQGDRHAQLFR